MLMIASGANVALTVRAALMVRLQLLLLPKLAHAPPQLWRKKPVSGAAFRSTTVPLLYVSLQSEPPLPQLMPAGLLVSEPLPPPILLTSSMTGLKKLALAMCVWLAVSEQLVLKPRNEQSSSQPPNALPEPGVSVRLTTVPGV